MRQTASLSVLLLAFLLACVPARDADTPGAAARDEHGHDAEPAAAQAAAPAAPRVEIAHLRGVAFSKVGAPVEEGAWFAAEAANDERDLAALSAPIGGVIAEIRSTPGAEVAAGQTILALRSAELADLKAGWLGARARHARAVADFERERRLAEGQATSRRDLEAAEADAAVAAAELEAARLQLAARGVSPQTAGDSYFVRAPRAGRIEALSVALGQAVAAGTELGRVRPAVASMVRLELPLPGPQAWQVGAVTEARASDGRRWRARVEGLPAALSADTRRLAYRLRLEGQELPVAGAPLEVRVPLARGIVVSQDAMQQIEGTWGVFVRVGEHAEFRPVRRGAELGGDVLLLDGLETGDEIATAGAYLLKSLWLKQAGGGETHEH